jgi:hypothetical protein
MQPLPLIGRYRILIFRKKHSVVDLKAGEAEDVRMAAIMSKFLFGWIGRVNGAVETANVKPWKEEPPLYRIGPRLDQQEWTPHEYRHGPQHEVTRHLMTDSGVKLALHEYCRRGGADMIGIAAYLYVPAPRSLKDYLNLLVSDKWGGAFLDGYQVEIRNLSANSGRERVVEICVSGLPIVVKSADNREEFNERGRAYSSTPGYTDCYCWIEELSLGGEDV